MMGHKIYLQRRPEIIKFNCEGCYLNNTGYTPGCVETCGGKIWKQVTPKRLLRKNNPDSLKNTIAIDTINGNDKNPGTIEQPVQTIDTAYKRMKEQEKTGILSLDSEVYKNIYKDGNV